MFTNTILASSLRISVSEATHAFIAFQTLKTTNFKIARNVLFYYPSPTYLTSLESSESQLLKNLCFKTPTLCIVMEAFAKTIVNELIHFARTLPEMWRSLRADPKIRNSAEANEKAHTLS